MKSRSDDHGRILQELHKGVGIQMISSFKYLHKLKIEPRERERAVEEMPNQD